MAVPALHLDRLQSTGQRAGRISGRRNFRDSGKSEQSATHSAWKSPTKPVPTDRKPFFNFGIVGSRWFATKADDYPHEFDALRLALAPNAAAGAADTALEAVLALPLRHGGAALRRRQWPDELRNMVCTQGSPSPCYRDDGYTPPDAGTGINTGYADLRLRKYWHFEDLGFSPDGTPIKEPFAFNAETQIAAFDAALGDAGLSDGAKSYDLAWLLHMVGDVHQPLHAVSRFTTTTPSGDSGGNAVKICLPGSGTCDEAHAKALHSFWDGAVGTNSSPQSAIDKAEHLQKTMFATAVTDSAPGVWVAESFELARNVAYAAPVGPGKGPYRLTTQYVTTAGTTAEQRVTLGGARLARILNRRLN
jgi:hypothetical protein